MVRPPRLAASLVVLLVLSLVPATAQSQGRGRGYGRPVDGAPGRRAVKVERAPDADALTGQAAIDALQGRIGQLVRDRGENPDDFATLLAIDDSVALGSEGHLVFADATDPTETALEAAAASTTAAATGPAPTPAGVAANGLPLHHSKPGAPWTIYLDFESSSVPVSPAIRSMINPRLAGVLNSAGLTLDTDSSTFSPEEQDVISRAWGRVAEDWTPFDVDVTTERPASFATNAWGGPRVIWNVITRSESLIGYQNGSLYGIAATLNLCGISSGFTGQVAFTFWGTTGATNHSDIADTVSHETGHVVGLVHDGFMFGNSFQQYYGGHGTGATSWGPLMGGPINRNVTQWSNGGYPNASNGNVCGSTMQDDVAHITRTFGARLDESGDTIATALPLTAPTRGVIGATTDVDVYALPRADDVRIQITPFRAGEQTDGGNLDVAAEIVNAAGLVVARADDLADTAAEIRVLLPSGQHFLRLESSADPANYSTYGSVGQYSVTGTFINTVRITDIAAPLPTDTLAPGRMLPVKFTLSDTVSAARVQLWSDASPLAATVLAETACQAQQGLRQHCNLKLPKSLVAGGSYWIALQFESLGGQWITAQVAPGGATSNPVAFIAR